MKKVNKQPIRKPRELVNCNGSAQVTMWNTGRPHGVYVVYEEFNGTDEIRELAKWLNRAADYVDKRGGFKP